MGFRNPITSAAAVDTGRGLSDAGVRLYQDTSVPAVPQGVAEWRTGTMDRNATIKLAGGGSGGSSFTVDGGASSGVAAPTVGLNVEGLPAGGYGPVLRLTSGTGGRAVVDNLLYGGDGSDPLGVRVTAGGASIALSAGIGEWGTADAYLHLRYLYTPTGLVFVNGLVQVTGALTSNRITTHKYGYVPLTQPSAGGQWPIIGGAVADTARLFDVRNDGIYLRGAAPAVGNFISLNGFYETLNRTY